jgi:hypothetical protein
MRKPASLMIAFSLPGAHGDAPDEDSLNREQGDDGDDDIAGDATVAIVECLHKGPSGIRDVRLLARGLEDMAQAVMSHDDKALEDAACDFHEVLSGMIED